MMSSSGDALFVDQDMDKALASILFGDDTAVVGDISSSTGTIVDLAAETLTEVVDTGGGDATDGNGTGGFSDDDLAALLDLPKEALSGSVGGAGGTVTAPALLTEKDLFGTTLPDLMQLPQDQGATMELAMFEKEATELLSSSDPFLFEQTAVAEPGKITVLEEYDDQGLSSSVTSSPPSSTAPESSTTSNRNRTASKSSDEGIDMSSNSSESNLEAVEESGSPASPGSKDDDAGFSDSAGNGPGNYIVMEVGDHAAGSAAQTAEEKVELDDNGDALCYVCREKAGKHSYYGGRVCPSCRAFFRRAVQSKYYEIFFCAKGEKCEINLKTRRSCQYCRFKKCLESGMRIAWVLPDGERNRRFNKLSKSKQQQHQQQSQLKPGDPGYCMRNGPMAVRSGPNLSIMSEEWEMINRTSKILCTNARQIILSMFNTDHKFTRDIVTYCYFDGKITYDFFKRFNRLYDGVTFELFMMMEGFRQLPLSDRKQLVEVNGPHLKQLKMSMMLQDESFCLYQGIKNFAMSGQFPAIQDLSDKISTLEEAKGANYNPRLRYDQFYTSPWAATKEDEERHLWITKQLKNWPRDHPDGNIDDTLMVLIKFVMAFNTDFVKLERTDIVQGIQTKYAYLLQRYLKFRYGEKANAKFMSGLMLVSLAHEAEEIEKRRLPV